ncbi:MAG: alpha-E domain-containing protein [Gammaproteobacteria bacterium]|nr:alpha-E domain-containing protein [Gammaproteobacteria bacterium]
MLSRVAERIYWMGRYLERADNTARLINVNTTLLLDLPRKITLGWQPLIDITGATAHFKSFYGNDADERDVVRYLVTDTRNSGSIMSSLQSARENARTIRDIMPRDAWEYINGAYLQARAELPNSLGRGRRMESLNEVQMRLNQIDGLLSNTMLHDPGYLFLRTGRHLERADMTTRIIDVRSVDLLPESPELAPFYTVQWRSVLRSLNGYQAYRIRMQAPVAREPALEFLFQDDAFPRSFLFSLQGIRAALRRLPRHDAPLRVCNRVIRTIDRAEVEALSGRLLNTFIDERQRELAKLHDSISRTYFKLLDGTVRRAKKKRKKT